MDSGSTTHSVITPERPFELELADGTKLVPQAEAKPTRCEGDANHAFTLADVQRVGGEPFQGYRRV
jgi:hypothetical protein